MANKDQPLKVEVVGGLLTISIGVSLLCHAVGHAPASALADCKITDEDVFARAIAEELAREEEDGTTPVHRMFDAAADEAVNQGAEGIWVPGDD